MKVVAFHTPSLDVRGTNISVYDYAHFNETLLKNKKYKIPASIELEYDIPANSDAVKETKKCFEYAKQILEN